MKRKLKTPKYGFSFHQDRALDLCKAQFGPCPFGCAKDGAPNCDTNVRGASVPGYPARQCEPGRLTQIAKDDSRDTTNRNTRH